MAEPLDAADLHDLRLVSDPALSPDGERVAFVVREADPDEDEFRHSLFVAPTDGSRDPHRLTRLGAANSPKWGPRGDRLAFLGTRDEDVDLVVGSEDGSVDAEAESDDEEATDEDEEDSSVCDGGDDDCDSNGDEPNQQLWLLDLARGGDARQLTAFAEGIREFDWAPDGSRLVVSARDPTDEEAEYLQGIREETAPYELDRTQHKLNGAGYLDGVTTYLFVVDADAAGIDADDASRLDDAYGRGAYEPFVGLQPAWGPDDRIAFVAYYGETPDETYALDVHAIGADGTDRRTLTDGSVSAHGLRWSPDGDRLAFAAGDATNFYRPTELHVADPDAGETWSVSASLDRTVSWAGDAEWVDDETLLAPVADGARARLVRFDAGADDPERVFEAQGTGRTIGGFDATPDTTAMVLSAPRDGRDVYALPTDAVERDADAPDAPPTRVSAVNADLLADAALPTCQRVTFENGDGVEVEGLLWLPAGVDAGDDGGSTPDEPLPLICHVHGGPMAFDAPSFSFDYAHWTGRGYAVLNVNYRGSTSYGREFSECIRGEWGPREVDDILSGVESVVERGVADPDRLFLSGFSQGGINTLYVVTRDDRFAAAAPEHGIYDFLANFGVADMHQWYVNDMGEPWEDPEPYREISSIGDVDRIDTPLLITAGEQDWRCPPSQAEALYVSARRAGVEAKLVVYQDENHGISRPGRHVHRLETLTEWFADHDPAAAGDDEA